MAALVEGDRFDIWAELMRRGEAFAGMSKADVRAYIDATDDWIEANQASYNASLPLSARTSMTSREKAFGFMEVAVRKFEVA